MAWCYLWNDFGYILTTIVLHGVIIGRGCVTDHALVRLVPLEAWIFSIKQWGGVLDHHCDRNVHVFVDSFRNLIDSKAYKARLLFGLVLNNHWPLQSCRGLCLLLTISFIIIAHTLPFIICEGSCCPVFPLVSVALEIDWKEITVLTHLIAHLCIYTGSMAIIKILFFQIILFLINGVNRWLSNLI